MSDLLQQAIIDAAALKEAAIKNAENLLVEKYSQEFKQTVEKLLEQEQVQTSAPQDPAQQAAPVDPMQQDAQSADATATSDNAQSDNADKTGAFSRVGAAFLDEGDENDLITINFDQLKETMMEMLGHEEEIVEEAYDRSTSESRSDATLDELGAGVASAALEEEMDEELELDESLEQLDEGIENILNSFSDPEKSTVGQELRIIAALNNNAKQINKNNASEILDLVLKTIKSTQIDKKIVKDAFAHITTSLKQINNSEISDKLKQIDTLSEVNGGPETLEKLEEIELEEDFELEEMMGSGTGAVTGTPAAPKIKDPLKAAAATKTLTGLQSRLANETGKINTQIAGAQRELASAQEPVRTTLEEEEMELSEEELAELEEALHVDILSKRQGRGHMGTTEGDVEKQRNMELAAAQDDDAREEREEEKRKMEDLVKENLEVKLLNNKLLSVLESLKEQVEKMNVSNAKLLYTNKALANISLNERQKNQIVESISKADSVLAAKTIYETVQNAVENNVKKEAPQSLRETLNRSQSPFVVKKTSANNINDMMAERMKALAGIKK